MSRAPVQHVAMVQCEVNGLSVLLTVSGHLYRARDIDQTAERLALALNAALRPTVADSRERAA